ncbi:MAG: response regulator [Actinomycetes bacterium]
MAQSNSLLLVVDDNKDIRELLKHILTLNGFDVQEAAEGATALRLIDESRPALVLLDVMMPGLSGYDVVEKVREHPDIQVSEVPILMITAKSQIADVESGMASGANDYLIKPFRPAALMEKVSEMLVAKVKDDAI